MAKPKISEKTKDETYIVIAAYYEEGAIGDVVNNLKDAGYENIVVVNDGSDDDTSEEAEEAGATVLEHVINRGQGASLQTGIDYALDEGAEYIVTFDADGQHQVKDLPSMIEPVESGEVDVTLGSRFIKGHESDVPLARKILLKGSVIVQTLFYGVKLTDAHNGFRCFSRKAAEEIEITSDRMEHASQIAEEIVHKDLSLREVPVDIVYDDYSSEKGHGGYLQAIKVFFRMLFRKFLR